jgi:hypothetical protein
VGGHLRTLPVSETHVGSSEGLGSIAGLVRSSDSDVGGCRCPAARDGRRGENDVFGRYAASRRASFEPASSHAESAGSRVCRTCRDRAKGLTRGVRGGTKSAVPASAGRLPRWRLQPRVYRDGPPAEGLSRRSAGRGSIASSVRRPRVYGRRARAEVRESSLPDLGMRAISDDRDPRVDLCEWPVYLRYSGIGKEWTRPILQPGAQDRGQGAEAGH